MRFGSCYLILLALYAYSSTTIAESVGEQGQAESAKNEKSDQHLSTSVNLEDQLKQQQEKSVDDQQLQAPIIEGVDKKFDPSNFHMGFGKRFDPSNFHMGFGKKFDPSNFHMGFGKKFDPSNFHMGFGKKFDPSNFHMGFGKRRAMSNFDAANFQLGLGRRSSEEGDELDEGMKKE